MAYLGKGQLYGLEELIYNARHRTEVPLQRTLRAVGYVDVLRIPTALMERYVLPTLRGTMLRQAERVVAASLAEAGGSPQKLRQESPGRGNQFGLARVHRRKPPDERDPSHDHQHRSLHPL